MPDTKKDIASAANEAIRVIANAAAEAIKVTKSAAGGDHDLLIELKTKLDGLINDVKTLNDGTSKQINDHETRIRTMEKDSEDLANIKRIVYGSVGIILVAVFSAIIYLVIK